MSFTTTDSSFDCSTFDDYHTQGIIKGTYSCQAGVSNTTSSTSTGSTTQPTSTTQQSTPSSSRLSKNAKIGIGIGVGIVGLMIIAIAFFFIFKQSRKNESNVSTSELGIENKKMAELGNGKKMAELEQHYTSPVHEMDEQRNRTELLVEEAPGELDARETAIGHKRFSWVG